VKVGAGENPLPQAIKGFCRTLVDMQIDYGTV